MVVLQSAGSIKDTVKERAKKKERANTRTAKVGGGTERRYKIWSPVEIQSRPLMTLQTKTTAVERWQLAVKPPDPK